MSAAVAGIAAGSGAIAGLLFALRCASAEERQYALEAETHEGLKAICVGLRVRASGSREELVQLIHETILHDEATCDPSTPTGKIVGLLGRIPEQDKVAVMLSMRFSASDLKEVCRELRLPRAGRKAELAERIARETYELWRAWQTPSPARGGGGAAAAPARAAGVRQEATSEAALADQASHAAGPRRDLAAEAARTAGDAETTRAARAAPEAAGGEGRGCDVLGAAGSARGAVGGPWRARVEVLSAEAVGPAQWAAPDGPAAAAATRDTAGTAAHERVAGGSRRVASGAPRPQARGGALPARGPRGARPRPGAAPAPAGAAWVEEAASPRVGAPAAGFVRTEAIPGRDEVERRDAQRFARRRMRLVGYCAEEFASTFGGEKERYLADLQEVLGGVRAPAWHGVAV